MAAKATLTKVVLYPNPQIYHHLKTIFVHVPKTAGTSIERHLRQSVKDIVGGHTTALAYKRKFPNCFATYYKFAVIRHPLERFTSAYRYLRGSPVHAALNNKIIHDCDSMEGFIKMVRMEPGILGKIVHMMPQHGFVCDSSGTVLVDELFKYENLDTAWKQVCGRIGVEHRILARLNVSDVFHDTHGNVDELQKFVGDMYAKDFAIFDYELST